MREALIESVRARFRSYDDLIQSIDAAQLTHKLDVERHKSLLEHFWCVVGARESHTRALAAGSWQGFACSMTEYSHAEVIDRLRASADEFESVVAAVDDWSADREQLLIDLAEHEAMHEGGIIRHMYGAGLAIPKSVKWA